MPPDVRAVQLRTEPENVDPDDVPTQQDPDTTVELFGKVENVGDVATGEFTVAFLQIPGSDGKNGYFQNVHKGGEGVRQITVSNLDPGESIEIGSVKRDADGNPERQEDSQGNEHIIGSYEPAKPGDTFRFFCDVKDVLDEPEGHEGDNSVTEFIRVKERNLQRAFKPSPQTEPPETPYLLLETTHPASTGRNFNIVDVIDPIVNELGEVDADAIAAPHRVFVLHLYDSIEGESPWEITEKPTDSGGTSSDLIQRGARTARFQFRVASGLTVPEGQIDTVDYAVTQNASLEDQLSELRELDGAFVRAYASKIGLEIFGMVDNVQINDITESDNTASGMIKVREIPTGTAEEGGGAVDLGVFEVPIFGGGDGAEDRGESGQGVEVQNSEEAVVSSLNQDGGICSLNRVNPGPGKKGILRTPRGKTPTSEVTEDGLVFESSPVIKPQGSREEFPGLFETAVPEGVGRFKALESGSIVLIDRHIDDVQGGAFVPLSELIRVTTEDFNLIGGGSGPGGIGPGNIKSKTSLREKNFDGLREDGDIGFDQIDAREANIILERASNNEVKLYQRKGHDAEITFRPSGITSTYQAHGTFDVTQQERDRIRELQSDGLIGTVPPDTVNGVGRLKIDTDLVLVPISAATEAVSEVDSSTFAFGEC